LERGELSLFALNSSRDFGEKIARELGVALKDHEERDFEDGEHKVRPLVNVRGRDVFVVQSLYSDSQQSVNDKLCRLLFFIGALKDASAGRVTAVIPYLAYARKDRKTKSRDPVTTRYVAALFEAVGADRVVTMDVHNLAAYQNAFRCPTDHLEANSLFVQWLAPRLRKDKVVAVSPDAGGVKRVDRFREVLGKVFEQNIPTAFMEKQRSEGVVSGEALVGEVADRAAMIIDDLVSSGTTLARAAAACRDRGAKRVFAAVTHGIFVGGANTVLADEALENVLATDTIPPFRLDPSLLGSKVIILEAAPLFAKAIERIHAGGSLVELMET
jgi:ribose-phosphate pyrophosphokinase